MMQGIQTLGPGVADKMAAMGQFEDDQIAHVAEGEVIVPAPIMKYYPEVKEQVFSAIREEGLDPEQFIVGGEMVAINPNTGVQEFSFFSKVFKKIKKFVKKAAPLLIAAALPMAAPAVFGSSAVLGGAAAKLATASALDAALKGGNLKDALKAGATGAVVGGIGQFASNLAGGGTGGYISGADYNPAATAGVAPTSTSTASTAATPASSVQSTPAPQAQGITGVPQAQVQPASINFDEAFSAARDPNIVYDELGMATNTQPFTVADAQKIMESAPTTDYSTLSLSNSSVSPAMPSVSEGLGSLDLSSLAEGAGEEAAKETAKKGFFEKIATEFKENPLPATGTVLSSASLAAPLFMDEEMPEQSDMTVSREELAQMLGGEEFLSYAGTSLGGLYYNPETQQYQDVPYVQSSGIMTAAGGGHIMGPGTGTSDSIPAYLSDGEFVMTADAVKGAGNGDRKKGAAKMYAMMSKFEGQA